MPLIVWPKSSSTRVSLLLLLLMKPTITWDSLLAFRMNPSTVSGIMDSVQGSCVLVKDRRRSSGQLDLTRLASSDPIDFSEKQIQLIQFRTCLQDLLLERLAKLVVAQNHVLRRRTADVPRILHPAFALACHNSTAMTGADSIGGQGAVGDGICSFIAGDRVDSN